MSTADESTDRPTEPSEEQVAHRAEQLLPEEQVAGSDDPQAQAEALLEESEERVAYESGDE
ncbi:hypothetical protein GCM10027047_25500 [Rhodococcus aerolatus]